MAKVILTFLDNKEVECSMCNSKKDFMVDDSYYFIAKENGELTESLRKIRCACGAIILYESCGKKIETQVWDDKHEGDTIISEY